MPKLITPNLRTHIAKQFHESITETANTIYYAFAAKSSPFDDDLNPPVNGNSTQEYFYDIYDELIFGKRITPQDVRFMIRKIMWESGKVFTPANMNLVDLQDYDFYTITEENDNQSEAIEYSVFKCLNNNGGQPSTVKPRASEVTPEDDYYRTSDGYEWKYMFTIPANVWNKFNTNKYAPIVENANVAANAVFGTVETYIVEDAGRDYNSYAKGFVRRGSVAGNNQIISLAGGKNVTLTVDDVSGFDIETITSDSDAEGVIILKDVEQDQVQLAGITGVFTIGDTIYNTGNTISSVIRNVEYEVDSLSSNSGFYEGSSIYIRSGAGEGQLRLVTEYIVTGDERRVLLDSAFTTPVDTTSAFEIAPTVNIEGDGAGAKAFAIIDTARQFSIKRIEVIDKGANYTYANATITANTGFLNPENLNETIVTSSANLTPLISPPGGHGSDPINELYGNRVSVSVDFNNSEGGAIPTQNDFRKVGIIKEPLYANLELQIESTDGSDINPTSFFDDEVIIGYTPAQTQVVIQSFVYTLNRYETLEVSNSTSLNTGDTVYAYTVDELDNDAVEQITSGVVTYKSGTEVRVLKDINDTGISFGDAEYLSLSPLATFEANFDANTEITIASAEFTYDGASSVIENSDDYSLDFSFVESDSDLPLELNVQLNNVDVSDNVTANTIALDMTGTTLDANTDVVYAYVRSTSESYDVLDEEGPGTSPAYNIYTIDELNTGSRAEVSNRTNTTLRLTNIRGDFGVGDYITGLRSGVNARVTASNRNNITFDQRTLLTVEMITPTNNFALDDIVQQPDTDGTALIHSINIDNENNTVELGLINVKGTFNVSDDASGTEFKIQTVSEVDRAEAKVVARQYPSLVYGKGEVLYVETFKPVTRNDINTERLKLLMEF